MGFSEILWSALGIGLVGWVIYSFNRLVRDRTLLREAWSGIDVQLKRRSSLAPNLIECVKGYANYEKFTLERIAEIRTQAGQSETLRQRNENENALTDQLKHLFALVESYPELRANNNFLELQKELTEIESQIQYSRRYYNGATRNYNIRAQSFPSVLVAAIFGFQSEEFFEIETATERANPEVKL
ncbi:MAG: LemA family protein [Phycisphaerales bacterium]|jgi:LemA protein|nr:LemA family protein [Phycisphaerales bacterium]